MIDSNEEIQEYITHNKIYIPTTYYDQDYKYTISNDEITIITDENCYTNYNTQYCDCYRYNERYNVITQSYSCNANPNNYLLSFTSISDDLNDSYRITNDYVKEYTIMYGIVIIALIVLVAFKKNSRRI